MAPPNEVSPTGDAPPRKATRKKKLNGVKKKSKAPPPPSPLPRKSLIRKRPVSFGNPALGTYHGCIYTLDVIGEDYSIINRPIIEGAESVERVVAMVDVPPDQVPEGILNLARSHRPYLYHVRIVIAENNEEFQMETGKRDAATAMVVEEEEQPTLRGQEETKDEVPSSSANLGLPLQSTSLTASVVENAASIMAADEGQQQVPSNKKHDATKEITSSDKGKENGGNGNDDNTINVHSPHNNNKYQDDDTFSASSKTYVVLLELCSVEAAEGFVEDLHGKPYTSLDPTQKCSVYQVLALTGEDGVSLLSPIFAPTAKSTSPKANGSKNNTTTAALPSNGSSSSSGSTGKKGGIVPTKPSVSASTPSASTHRATPPAPTVEDYNCAVCLEHMILSEVDDNNTNDSSKIISSIMTTVCNHSFHMDCLLKWQDSPCPVCRYDHSGLNEALSQCHICGTTENNYVCLICGVVSCGGPPIIRGQGLSSGAASTAADVDRMLSQSPVCGIANNSSSSSGGDGRDSSNNSLPPDMDNSRNLSQSHARRHYDETLHAYALDTETQHVWDFAGQGYVHRLLQNKEDGKLVEFHDPSNTSSHERSLTPGLSDVQEGEVLHRKLEGFASQYYTLLKSQLEQQRIYYQGRLEELRRESLVRKKAQTSDLINALKQERAQLSKRVVSLKARHCKVVEDTAFLKNMNESLEANKDPLKRKVKEAQRQRIEARNQLEQSLPVLEGKVTSLLQELTGETPGDSNENNEAAAQAATSGENPKTLRHCNSSGDDRKPAAKR